MQFKIMSQRDNALIGRKEMELLVDYENGPTPSIKALEELLAKEFSVQAENIEIRQLISETGRSAGKVKVHVWHGKKPEKKVEKKKEATGPNNNT